VQQYAPPGAGQASAGAPGKSGKTKGPIIAILIVLSIVLLLGGTVAGHYMELYTLPLLPERTGAASLETRSRDRGRNNGENDGNAGNNDENDGIGNGESEDEADNGGDSGREKPPTDIEIPPEQPDEPGVDAEPAKINLDRTLYVPGEVITVTVSGITAEMISAAAFVAIYDYGTPHWNYQQYMYPRSESATLEFEAPYWVGQYEMRLYSMDYVYTDETFVMSIPFNVVEPGTPTQGYVVIMPTEISDFWDTTLDSSDVWIASSYATPNVTGDFDCGILLQSLHPATFRFGYYVLRILPNGEIHSTDLGNIIAEELTIASSGASFDFKIPGIYLANGDLHVHFYLIGDD